ncbi:hypothetical protein [Blastopirellula marina]|uniref:Outer membrane protein beta-barrel domain-containing protein n=1 Tax=Blastopirellula marina TaxID=124 RepID=A0A2S8F6L1_9BACT|nr:hypothetical protein [Blastopirellula marina]PQO27778.1 hypothetical protein C5Y98_27180 [Blastopirellula marina]PTL41518.1 hypothetical protein C5Y97_27195 [Blastopirellula marina]
MRTLKFAFLFQVLLVLTASTAAWAQSEFGPSEFGLVSDSLVPRSAFYFGLGTNYNSVNIGNQDVIAIGTSDVISSGTTIATGMADGPDDATGGTPIFMDAQLNFSPSVELGYFRHFEGSEHRLWGLKFTNDYLGTSSVNRDIRLPQVGQFTYASDPLNPVPFTGNAVATSIRTDIVDQLAFRPYLGHSFESGFVYIGGGPTLTNMRTEITDLVGFADINGTRGDISGAPQDFSDSGWVWGGSVEVGVTHFFCQSWFLECSCVFGITANHQFNFDSTFSNPDPSDPTQVKAGTLVGSSTWQGITQSIGIRLCKTF